MRSLFVLAMLAPAFASAQTANVGNENASTSAVIIEGSGAPRSTQTLKTNPDGASAIGTVAPSVLRYCEPYQAGSYLFGQVSTSQCFVDEPSTAIATSRHLLEMAVTARNLGLTEEVRPMFKLAKARMHMTQEQWESTFPKHDAGAWEEFWRP